MEDLMAMVKDYNNVDKDLIGRWLRRRKKKKIRKIIHRLSQKHADAIYNQTEKWYEDFVFNSLN